MLEIKDLCVKYGDYSVLNQIYLSLNTLEIVSIVGPNACGKSTLLKAINSEVKIHRGSILLNISEKYKENPEEVPKYKAVLPQSSGLNFDFKVSELVLMGRYPYFSSVSKKRNLDVVMFVLERLEIEDLFDRSYLRLSGGEQQRVHFARILAQIYECYIHQKGGVVFLDEPISNLDLKHQYLILELLKELRDSGITIFLVIHNLEQAMNYSDRVVLMKRGRIMANGKPEETLTSKRIKNIFEIENEWISSDNKNFLKILPKK